MIRSVERANARSAVLMFTDGWDTDNSYAPPPALTQSADVTLYAAGATSAAGPA